jgi:hypothetical protein
MANLNFVTDRLATGGDLAYDRADALRDLNGWQRLGITHVVDNRLEWSDADLVAEWAPEINYLHNGVDDAGQRMPDEWFDTGTAFIRGALRSPTAKVLIHCHMGINRGPSLAYAALLALGWDPIDAMDAVRSARPIAGLGYAEDALDWHHHRQEAPLVQRRSDRRRLEVWRRENSIDVVRIIRAIRAAEAS